VSKRAAPSLYRPEGEVPARRAPRYSQSLQRGLAILGCFTPEHPVRGIADIADELGMSRSTTHRYVITLLELGYLEQSAARKYRLGLRPTDLGTVALSSAGLRDASRRYLEQLRRATGYTVALGALDGIHVVYVEHLSNRRYGLAPDGPKVRVGVRVPAYCTSMGKLLLAFLPKKDRDSVLAEIRCTRRTEHTITRKQLLREQLAEIPILGYAISDEEFHPGVRSIAVPVYDDSGLVAAVNLSAFNAPLSVNALIEDFYPLVGATAEKVSRVLGYEPSENGDQGK
jgi:IclR family pca regulon transcriptional regulator